MVTGKSQKNTKKQIKHEDGQCINDLRKKKNDN